MTRAADMMFVTQPAISRLIKDLEREVGLTLFKRRKGGLYPSEEAMSLYREVEQSFIGLKKIARTAQRIRAKRTGGIRIAGMPAMTLSFVPKVIKDFIADRSGTYVVLHTRSSGKVIEQVRMLHYDLGLAMTPVDRSGIEMGPVLHARYVCILPPGHPLADREVITVEDLRDEPFISNAERTMTRMKVDATFDAANVPRRMEIEGRWSASICSLVSGGLGVSIIEPFTAQEYASNGGIVRPFIPEMGFSFVIVRPAKTDMPPILKEFVETFNEALAPYLIEDGIKPAY